MKYGEVIFAAAVALAFSAGLTMTGKAAEGTEPFMHVSGATSSPAGHVEFCKHWSRECGTTAKRPQLMQLSRARWDELLRVNADVNHKIRPVSDEDLYHRAEVWTYPTDAGDCEDYVLLKRKILIGLGWSPSSLLITVAPRPGRRRPCGADRAHGSRRPRSRQPDRGGAALVQHAVSLQSSASRRRMPAGGARSTTIASAPSRVFLTRTTPAFRATFGRRHRKAGRSGLTPGLPGALKTAVTAHGRSAGLPGPSIWPEYLVQLRGPSTWPEHFEVTKPHNPVASPVPSPDRLCVGRSASPKAGRPPLRETSAPAHYSC